MAWAFEWDEKKRARNLAKHGVDFVRAALVFEGPIRSHLDRRRAYGEDRYVVFGETAGSTLAVVITVRGEGVRIISARKANRREQVAYRALRPEEA